MRRFTALTLLFLSTSALAQDPDPDLLQRANRQRTTGWAEFGGGVAGIGGGLALMLVGRPSGELSTEDPTLHEVRTMSGIGLLLGGFTTVMVGADTLGKASATRERAMLAVAPEPVAQGAGIRISGRF